MNTSRLIFIFLFFVPLLALSQPENPVKKIEVTGEAEMEVTPNEIYFRITLKEYLNGRRKVEMDKLEAELVKAIKSEGFASGDLTIESIYGYNWDWKKQRSEEFLATKSFKLKVADLKRMNDLLERLDQRGINNISIASYTHSDINQYQQELKLQALKNAKDKAGYMLTGIGAQLGSVLEVREIDQHQPVLYRARAMEAMDVSEYQSNVEFMAITLNASVIASFEIK